MGQSARNEPQHGSPAGCGSRSRNHHGLLKSRREIPYALHLFDRKLEPAGDEVAALMSLILTSLEEELFMKNNVKLRIIGDLSRVPDVVKQSILGLQERTAVNTGMTMVIALSYSSRWEITDTVKRIAAEVAAGSIKPEEITEQLISSRLATSFMPDPDLLIRTGGEMRLSNYLLWQCAYTEFYFCDTYWPDFHEADLLKAIEWFNRRERRFGKTSEQVEAQKP